MSSTVKALAARFGEHQRKFIGAGGKRKGLKYPKEWQAEAVRLRHELKMPIGELARELGIGHSALKRWCDRGKGAKAVRHLKPAKAGFLPVEIVTSPGRVVAPTLRAATARVTLREITVDIAPDADEAAAHAIIAALAKTGRCASC